MGKILSITGKVKYNITLDPGVWIFDDRKQDLHTFFNAEKKDDNSLEEYTKSVSKHWDREIMEGAVYPPTLKSEKKYEKEKLLTGTFGIPFEPFLKNAEVFEDASFLIIECKDEEIKMDLDAATKLILGFSKDGKPLNEDGPVHCYYGDGSNFKDPIKNVVAFKVI